MIPGDLPAALEKLGLSNYQIRGEEISASCPSGTHRDRHPSWSINIESGLHHCFTCGFSGDFSGLVMAVRGVDLDKALEWVYSLPLKIPSLQSASAPQQGTILTLAGFTLPPARYISEKYLTAEACERYELLFGDMCWIAPARHPRTGQLWGYQKKSAVTKKFWFEPGDITAHQTLFGAHLITPGCRVIVVESPIDAPRISAVGIDNLVAVATFGCNVTIEQIRFLSRARQIIWALDNDIAGWKETGRLARMNSGKYSVFEYGGVSAKDPGEMTNSEIIRGVDNAFSAGTLC